jgi:hypothetical protein
MHVHRVIVPKKISQRLTRDRPRQVPDKHNHALSRVKVRTILAHVELAVVQLLPIQDLDRTSSNLGGAVADEPEERGGGEGGREKRES